MALLAIYCADCGTECEQVTGREAGAREPDLIDAQVWACPLCLEAWAPCAADGAPIGLPAGPDTRNARTVLCERQVERLVAEALRAAVDDPATRGAESTIHIDRARPRRGEWWTTWANLPGFVRVNDHYRHDCLPGWEYARSEVRAEMIPDLEALAERGARPTETTSGGGDRG